MKYLKLLLLIFLLTIQQLCAQQKTDDKAAINKILDQYTKSVIEKDSITFYDLFNEGTVTWCAAIKDRSQAREMEKKGAKMVSSNYFSGSYKGFLRALFHYKSTEDKFDNVRIIEDGTVASLTMDYSFWANDKMTNWGSKYLTLIKRDGKWKITSVIYSLELTDYYEQPAFKDRQKQKI